MMKLHLRNLFHASMILVSVFCILLVGMPTGAAAGSPLVATVDELTAALMNAKDGDTILVDDITFKPMPMGMIVVPKNVTIKSGKKTNAVFTNATFALNGTTSDSAPLTVRFENIDFRGDQAGTAIDPDAPPTISSELPGIMKTMCAAIFKMNVHATYANCSFEGYHYGYGGVFNAIYSSEDNKNALTLTLSDCTFRNNASKYGGCIYVSGFNHNVGLDARRCVFEDNAAATGGAIWAQNANIRLTECSLIGNRYLNAQTDAPNGGALSLYNCSAELDGCLIADNTSGGKGAGIFCEITPFKTLIVENCTLIGNTGAEDEGISVVPGQTNFDTKAVAHIYFSSLVGRQGPADNTERFGCLLVDANTSTREPGAENGYCLELTPESARESGLIPTTPGHVSLPQEKYAVPKEVAAGIAGGKFSDSLGRLHIGDNYREEAAILLEDTPGHTESVTVRYHEAITLNPPTRKGFSFAGWEYPDGTTVESGRIFLGGVLPEGNLTARWHFVLSENLYVIWGPLLVIVAAGAVVFAIVWRKKKSEATVAPVPDTVPGNVPEDTPALPQDWIARVCEKTEITGLLSRRELEVLPKLLEGKSRKQIAEELFVTEATIKKHSASIYSKLEVHNRADLIFKLTKQ